MRQLLTVLIIMFFCLSCEDSLKKLDRLSVKEVNRVQNIQVNFCTMDAQVLRTKLKFLFVLDKSGSNQERSNLGNIPPTLPGSDISGSRRYDPLISFISSIQKAYTPERPDDDSTSYALVNFASAASIVRNFSSDEESFIDLIINQKYRSGCEAPVRSSDTNTYPPVSEHPAGCPSDSGATNYANALTTVKNMINLDSEAEKNANPNQIISSHYVVFFISDGAPVVGFDANGLPQMQTLTSIRNVVDDIIELSQSSTDGTANNSAWVESIQVHTGYYYSDTDADATAKNYLRSIAEDSGGGQAHEFAGSQPIDFSSFRIPQRNVERLLDEIIVINKSSLWNGEYLIPDTDGDGMSDILEATSGSNLFNPDSDGNKVGDLVEYKLNGSPCLHPACNPSLAMNYACTNAEKNADLDRDGLSDCEEKLLGSRKELFDSNHDDLPDDLALRFNLGLEPTDPQDAHDNRDADSRDNYYEIKHDLPISFNNDKLFNLVSQTYELTSLGKHNGRSCYRLQVRDFKEVNTINKQTIIKVYIKEKTLLSERLYLRTSEKAVANGVDAIFNDDELIGN